MSLTSLRNPGYAVSNAAAILVLSHIKAVWADNFRRVVYACILLSGAVFSPEKFIEIEMSDAT